MDAKEKLALVLSVAIVAVLYQNGSLAAWGQSANVFLVQNYWVGWFILPGIVAAFFLYRRSILPVNQVLSPDRTFKTAMLEKGDDFLKKQYAILRQFYKPHPRLPYFLWDASKPNALGIRNFRIKSKALADELGLSVVLSVGYFVQQAPTPAGNRVAFIGSPLGLLNFLGASNFGHALTQSVGYSPEQKAFDQLERIARESGDEAIVSIYGQAVAQSAARTQFPSSTPSVQAR